MFDLAPADQSKLKVSWATLKISERDAKARHVPFKSLHVRRNRPGVDYLRSWTDTALSNIGIMQ